MWMSHSLVEAIYHLSIVMRAENLKEFFDVRVAMSWSLFRGSQTKQC